MLSRFKPKSEFGRNVITLMTGTTIAQAIPVAVSPILTRLYTPKDFGVFALFISVAAVFGSIASARYELAIMLPKKDEDAINIAALCLVIISLLSLVLLLITAVFNAKITELLGSEEISMWLYLAPLSVFLIGLFNTLKYYNNRLKNYKDIAKASIHKSLMLGTVQIVVGSLKPGVTGLIIGSLISGFFANTRLLKNTIANQKLSIIKPLKIIALAKRYKDFPKYSLWATLANTLSNHLVNILISIFYNVTTLGYYSLVQRALGMPASLVGSAIGQVFFEQATKEKQHTGNATETFSSAVKKLLLIGLPTFSGLFIVIEDLFAIVFGEEWRIAGEYAKILIPLFLMQFVASSISTINIVFEKQNIGLLINITLLASSTSLLFIAKMFALEIVEFLYLFSTILSFEYFIFFIYYLSLSRGKI
ncbi:lipopolysaccharide biosynthesis protein [Thiomicrolovo sp. ZZH C-3]